MACGADWLCVPVGNQVNQGRKFCHWLNEKSISMPVIMVMSVWARRGAADGFLIRDLSQVLAVICGTFLMAAKWFITASDRRGLRWRAAMSHWRVLWNYSLDKWHFHLEPIRKCGSSLIVNLCTVCLCTDVIGVCKSVEDVTRITTKNSREVSKRNIQLMDMSSRVIQLTMWGNDVRKRPNLPLLIIYLQLCNPHPCVLNIQYT